MEVVRDEDAVAELVDHANGVAWYAFFFDSIRLALAPEAGFQRDVRHHARFLFERMFASDDTPGRVRPPEPRTARNDGWSPVVEARAIEIGGGVAAHVMHWMFYQPGLETLMGHLLVPVRDGVVELRCIAMSRQTGMRESVMLLKLATETGRDPAELMADRSAYNPDAAEYDPQFPDSTIARVRRALDWARTNVIVTAGPVAVPPPSAAFAFEPPPRFLYVGRSRGNGGTSVHDYTRVAFAGTDGVDRLFVTKRATPAKVLAATGFPPSSILRDGELAIAEATPGAEPLRIVLADAGDWTLGMLSTTAMPIELMKKEVLDAAASFGAGPRPWWKVWR